MPTFSVLLATALQTAVASDQSIPNQLELGTTLVANSGKVEATSGLVPDPDERGVVNVAGFLVKAFEKKFGMESNVVIETLRQAQGQPHEELNRRIRALVLHDQKIDEAFGNDKCRFRRRRPSITG